MDRSVLVTAAEFSRLVGGTVSAATVRSWRHRGLITPAGRRGNYTLYRVGELFDVEMDTRLNIERNGGVARKVA
jgi:DNA-binding transcriptional MerR regulator